MLRQGLRVAVLGAVLGIPLAVGAGRVAAQALYGVRPEDPVTYASVAITLSRRYAGYWVGAFVRYDDLDGAVFEDSPLVRTRQALVAGIAVSKIIAESRERVTGREIEF